MYSKDVIRQCLFYQSSQVNEISDYQNACYRSVAMKELGGYSQLMSQCSNLLSI